jgi:coenzyme PQQ precursor peptide PqqA
MTVLDKDLREFFQSKIDSARGLGYPVKGITASSRLVGGFMEWTAPAFEEVCLNCEINSYASAKL